MTGFADLVNQGQPAIFGGGVSWRVTEGQTWRVVFTDVNDSAGNPIDLSTGVTATCTIYDTATELTTLTVTLGNGTFTLSKAKADTVDLANDTKDGRMCSWKLELDNGTESVMVWLPGNSRLVIYPETAVA